jgi:DNA-binding NtrC family response regulator
MQRSRVLVVEDRPSVLRFLVTLLQDGYEVVTAPDGARALEAITSSHLDVVLTDIRMPGASGFEVLRAVRDRAPGARVVMMTAYANVPDAVTAMRLGAYDYVAKPLEADEILLVVARAAERLRDAVECGDGDGVPAETSPEVSLGFRQAVEEGRDRASREYLSKLMRVFQGNVTQAAKQARMTRESLHRVLRKYGVRSEHHRPASRDDDRFLEGAAGDGAAMKA